MPQEQAGGKCGRCGTPFEKAAKVEGLVSGRVEWCASCWASEKGIREKVSLGAGEGERSR